MMSSVIVSDVVAVSLSMFGFFSLKGKFTQN